jgi:glycosyltransferase involved in cell wall biosynthesis
MGLDISVVIPVYKSQNSIIPLYERLSSVLSGMNKSFQIVFVNDASPDNSLEVLKELHKKDSRVKIISFSRNFGQHYAISAGLDFAESESYVVMDCDLQDVPEELPKMIKKYEEGYDVVLGVREDRKDSNSKVLSSIIFYKTFNFLTGLDADAKVTNYGVYSSKVIRNLREFKENTRSFPIFVKWLGFKTTKVEISHQARFDGKSSYTLKKLFTLAFDIIISHSNKPLRFGISFGIGTSLFAFVLGIYLIARYFFVGVPVQGWTSILVAICFFSGMIMFFQGLLGIYIGKIYTETKSRPIYVIDQILS